MKLLKWHLGLGDALICNGLIRTLLERGLELKIPCYTHNLPSLKAMFWDVLDRIEFVSFNANDERYRDAVMGANEPSIDLGYYGKGFDPNRWDESFYRQAGIPFLFKWTKFHSAEIAPEASTMYANPAAFSKTEAPKPGGRFIHDDEERGFVIPLDGLRPNPKWGRITEWIRTVANATEIHCINSSFAILADLIGGLEGITPRKYLHRYARPDGGAMPIWGREWEILDKPL